MGGYRNKWDIPSRSLQSSRGDSCVSSYLHSNETRAMMQVYANCFNGKTEEEASNYVESGQAS